MPLFNQPPASLCILRLSAVGDVCHALAAVQQIQQYWPQTKITWIIGKTERQLFSDDANIEFIVYNKKSGWKGIINLWRQLKGRQFDALLNMQTAFRSSILSLGINAKYKIGFGKQRSREGQWLFVNHRIEDPATPHVLDGFMAFVEYLGVPLSAPHWQLNLTEEERQYVSQFIDHNKKNVVIAPCSSKTEKDWLIERYAEIADYIDQQGGNVIFCCSPAKRELAMVENIMQQCHFEPTGASGKTNLRQLAALISQADLVIAPDSGPAHIATVMNTPVIGLYAYHNPQRTGPYYSLDKVVSVYEQNVQKEFARSSAELPWATKLKGKNLMAEITVERVKNAIAHLDIFSK